MRPNYRNRECSPAGIYSQEAVAEPEFCSCLNKLKRGFFPRCGGWLLSPVRRAEGPARPS